MLSAQHPAWLWLALVLAILATAAALRFRSRSRRWLLAGILLPALSAATIALAFADLSYAARPTLALLLDFSPSARTSPWHDPTFVQSLAQHHLAPDQPLTVRAFAGGETRTLIPNITPADPWPAQFDWTAPANLVSQVPASSTPSWIISDGLLENPPATADPRTAFTVLPPTVPDAAIRDLIIRPIGNNGGGQREILVQLRAAHLTQNAPARFTLHRDNTLLADQTITFHPAPNASEPATCWLTLHDTLDASDTAPHHYTASIDLPNDPWPENNSAAATIPSSAPLRILTISNQRPAQSLGTFLPTANFTQSPADLAAQGWQLIVLHDVPAAPIDNLPNLSPPTPLSPAQAQTLDTLVRDNGTGLLITTSGHAFGPGRYGEDNVSGEIIESLSPVSSFPKNTRSASVLFLLDASASMNEPAPQTTERKIELLSRAVQSAAAFLADADTLTIVTFNNSATRLGQGDAYTLRPQLADLLRKIQPAGPTNPDAALPELASFLNQTPAPRLIILVTDGEIPALDLPRWQSLLNSQDTHLAIIAPAPTDPAAPLTRLAATVPNTSWSQTPNPTAWPAALRQAILSQVRGTLQNSPLPWRAPPDLAGTAYSWTRTWRKPESTDVASALTTQPSATNTQPSVHSPQSFSFPVAASAQRGLGKVGAIPLTADNSPAYLALRDRLINTLAAPPGDRRFTADARPDPQGWLITADAIDKSTFINNETLFLQPLAAATAAPMSQTAPGHYEARLPPTPAGLAATILRQAPSPPPNTSPTPVPQLVARLQAPALQTTEFPATLDSPAPLPANTIILPPTTNTLWTPPGTPTSLTPALLLLATLSALTALYLRK
jgi:hypothetical protein